MKDVSIGTSFFDDFLFVNGCFLFLDVISDDLRDIRYRHECRYIGIVDYLLDGRNFYSRDYAVEHCLLAVTDHTFAFHLRACTAELRIDLVGDILAVIRDDHYGLALLHAVLDDVYHLGCDEVCKKRIECSVRSEKESCNSVDDYVEEQYDLTYGKLHMVRQEHRNDLRAVQGIRRILR